MGALARFIMRGKSQAILVISSLMIVSWLLSLASLLASAAISLPTLRRGGLEGLLLMLGALPLVALAGQLVMGDALQAIGFCLIMWIPVVLVSLVLRETTQLSLSVMTAVGLGVISVMGFYAIVDDPTSFWDTQLLEAMKPMLAQSPESVDGDRLNLTVKMFSRFATGAIAAGSVLSVLISLLIARWWQASLYNPGGFRPEFLSLGLPKWASLILILILSGVLLGGDVGIFAANLMLPVFMGFIVTGFAIIHAVCGGSPSGRFWLIGVYIALMFIAPMLLLIALLGVFDPWINIRKRLGYNPA